MLALQHGGIAAAAVLNARELVENRHLAERAFYRELRHDSFGTFPFGGAALRFSATPVTYRIGSSLLGEYNDDVLTELGLGREPIGVLRRQGVISDIAAAR
jgi:crotonobetainyl-CoA:carnitine CoA-transferase CaiB-like acyl-CoA transferase